MKEISEQEKKLLSLVKPYYKDLKVVECDVVFKVDGAIEHNVKVMINTPKDFETEKFVLDDEIFYYCRDIEDFKRLMKPNNGEDFLLIIDPFNN